MKLIKPTMEYDGYRTVAVRFSNMSALWTAAVPFGALTGILSGSLPSQASRKTAAKTSEAMKATDV